MLPSAILISAFSSAHLIGDAVGGSIGVMATEGVLTGGTAAVGGLAVTQGEAPGSPSHGAVMRHICPVAVASGRRATRRHTGREGLRAAPRAFI